MLPREISFPPLSVAHLDDDEEAPDSGYDEFEEDDEFDEDEELDEDEDEFEEYEEEFDDLDDARPPVRRHGEWA
jgi:hypothetical protein